MDFEFDPQLEDFRQEVRRFVVDNLPADMKARQEASGSFFASAHDEREWMRILATKGWSVPHWPREWGGLGWSAQQLFIFEEEQHNAFAPPTPIAGTHMLGPLIYTFGSQEQKEKFLPAIREGRVTWCQGFSEPGSGSDLASLRTRADLVGDKYVVSGQKIWTSAAHDAQWGFFLVKTDTTVKAQLGISFLLIDMTTPGIAVRQIPQMNNEAHVCETFLDNVEVPAENLLGEAGKGWNYGKFLLDHERTASSYIFYNKREFRRALALAESERVRGNPVADDPGFRARFVRIEAELTALELSVKRVLAEENFTYGDSASASVLKIRGSELMQSITELHLDLLGEKSLRSYSITAIAEDAGAAWPPHVVGRTNAALILRGATIFGGTKQVQKNIVAKLAFGL